MQARLGSLKVLGGPPVLLAADVLVLGHGSHAAQDGVTVFAN
ncbi:hypothetical protein A6P39_016600 [Streptomyces sp. FXJ1.172]|nr:hypothetical protein [Streptomyces sp. FXJ1.172]WEP00514.1 hypothetical protein A6P39_016600 [Streptomyces sp. FXJ1.172]